METKELRELTFKVLLKSTYLAGTQHLSKRAERASEIISGAFGCDRQAVVDLVSLILGEDISLLSVEGRYGQVVVPLRNENGHNYPLNLPTAVISIDGSFSGLLRQDGTTGNNLTSSTTRLAKESEIQSFVEKLPEAALKRYFNHLETMASIVES